MRKHSFVNGQFYHIFNRGVEKRNTFLDTRDFLRFILSMNEFNTQEPIASLRDLAEARKKNTDIKIKKLVNIICYCLNTNHYHLLIEQVANGGVSEFMKRLSGGYTNYFNKKYRRSGVLFQGKFKSTPIESNEQLLRISVYVNLNNRVHHISSKQIFSSLDEYKSSAENGFCDRNIILKQFKNTAEYMEFADASLIDIMERKELSKELKTLLLE